MADSSMTPASKRRRLDQASKVLSRPFSTPLKRKTPANASVDAKTTTGPGLSLGQGTTTQSSSAAESKMRHAHHSQTDQEILRISKQIRAVRSDIDTLERATAIQETRNDEHLRRMIGKWQKAAQEAAEELFPSVKDRVMANGGVSSWRQSEINKLTHHDDISETKNQSCDISIDNTQQDQEDGGQCPEIISARDLLSSEATLDFEDEQAYSMHMMLRSLNIEPSLIGFDPATQTWSEGR